MLPWIGQSLASFLLLRSTHLQPDSWTSSSSRPDFPWLLACSCFTSPPHRMLSPPALLWNIYSFQDSESYLLHGAFADPPVHLASPLFVLTLHPMEPATNLFPWLELTCFSLYWTEFYEKRTKVRFSLNLHHPAQWQGRCRNHTATVHMLFKVLCTHSHLILTTPWDRLCPPFPPALWGNVT